MSTVTLVWILPARESTGAVSGLCLVASSVGGRPRARGLWSSFSVGAVCSGVWVRRVAVFMCRVSGLLFRRGMWGRGLVVV